MLAPIRPSPIIPSCMTASLVWLPSLVFGAGTGRARAGGRDQVQGCSNEFGTLRGGVAERIKQQVVLVWIGGVLVKVVFDEGLPLPVPLLHPPRRLFRRTAVAALDRGD